MQTVNDNLWLFHVTRKNKFYHMKKKNRFFICALTLIGFIVLFNIGCKENKEPGSQNIPGYGFFSRIPGLWHGPVSTSTTAGSFDVWYVDFRPISEGQVAQFSLLDPTKLENICFFIVKYNNQMRLAMRTEGCSNDTCCATYEMIDSVVEQEGYYRFIDFVKGKKRACTIFKFTGDQMVITTYTNKFNKSDTLVWHSTYTALLGTRDNSTAAAAHFKYPQPVMTSDFSNAFNNMNESIFFNLANDPYYSLTQSYVGSVTTNITVAGNLPTISADKVFLVFTTQPLFSGNIYNPENLKYISKYVFLPVTTSGYTIKDFHPGKYYVYALIDKNHDGTYQSGDYMSSNINNIFTVPENQNITIPTNIDYIIP